MHAHRACRARHAALDFRFAELAAEAVHANRGSNFTLPGAGTHYAPDVVLEPVHTDIAGHVDIANETWSGTVTHTVRARRDAARSLTLHAVDFEDVEVTDTSGAALSFSYDGREIAVTWTEPFDAGEERDLAIAFRVTQPTTGLFFSRPTAVLPGRAWYAATDNETERARHWLPTVDLPSVRPTLAFHLRAEERFTILANGALQDVEHHGDGTKTAHWRLEQPCPSYLTCFAVGEFVEHDDGDFEGRPVASYTTSHYTSDDLYRSFDRTKDMLAWLQDKLGHAFPYPKYHQFALPGFGGAMENISLVSWDDRFVLDATAALEDKWLVDQVNIHEMAHSYFGDMITCRDFAHAWLKESWATYTETLWLEHDKGFDEMQYDVFTNIERYRNESDNRYARPIVTREFNHSWQMYDGHLYPGGAARLHMLRHELGDDTFFDAVRTYVGRFAYRTVETSDFRRTLEEVSGRSLAKWFDQWLHRAGYPQVKATFAFDKEQGEGRFTLEQSCAADKKAESRGGRPKKPSKPFDLVLDLAWTIDGATFVREVRFDRGRQVFAFPMTEDPVEVRVDPQCRTVMGLEFDPGEKRLLTQLTGAADVVGRIRAARTLLDGGKRKRVEAVRDAYRKEAFWGVRVRIAEALSKAGTEAALGAMAELIAEEQDGLVLPSLLGQAARHRHTGIAAAIEKRLDGGLDMYHSRAAAFRALGAQRGAAPLDRLTAAAGEVANDPYGFAQSGALAALAATRSPDAAETISGRCAPGEASDRVRPTAARALGVAGTWLEEHRRPVVRERLEDLLRDPVDRVRDAAMAGLVSLGDPAAIPRLAALRNGRSDQERVDVDKAVATLRARARGKAGGKDKELEKLTERVRKLESTIEDLLAKGEATQDS